MRDSFKHYVLSHLESNLVDEIAGLRWQEGDLNKHLDNANGYHPSEYRGRLSEYLRYREVTKVKLKSVKHFKEVYIPKSGGFIYDNDLDFIAKNQDKYIELEFGYTDYYSGYYDFTHNGQRVHLSADMICSYGCGEEDVYCKTPTGIKVKYLKDE